MNSLMQSRRRPRPGMWILAGVPLVLVINPADLRAQRQSPVVPGIILHMAPAPGPDTVIYRRSITRGGVDSITGTRTVVMRIVAGQGGARLFEVVQRFPAGGGEIVDTALGDVGTLRAVAHRSHQPSRTMRFDFGGGAVEGMVRATGPAADSAHRVESVHQDLGGPIFDSNVLEVVIAALPLEPAFRAELPFFIYERGGRVTMAVAVRERARVTFPVVGEREAWAVTVGVPGAPATIWVDTETHAVLRTRYDITARGMSFTDDRMTPLQGEGTQPTRR
jgi:hypothetical protein